MVLGPFTMDIRRKVENQIKKKTQEINQLKKNRDDIDISIREAQAYVQAMEDMMKHLPTNESIEEATASIRHGSMADLAMKALKKSGRPLHIKDILEKLGRESTKQYRQALSGQLSHYVRQNKVFTRPAPNTFGLVEWDNGLRQIEGDIPSDFGEIKEEDLPEWLK
jgi:HB1, ASXL, restriction endonuclease HTH domain